MEELQVVLECQEVRIARVVGRIGRGWYAPQDIVVVRKVREEDAEEEACC